MNMWKLLLVLCCFGVSSLATGQSNNSSTDAENSSAFWIANFAEGQLMVKVSQISAVAQHRYLLDNAIMVYEINVLCAGSTPIKMYYLEPVGKNSGYNAVQAVTSRAKELGSNAINRASGGGINPDTVVTKVYPNTNTIEYRVATLDQLNKLYASLTAACKNGRGRTFRQ